MSDICATGCTGGANIPKSGNPADLEFYNRASGTVMFAFRAGAGSMPTFGVSDGLTAHAGGGQTGATPLTAPINRFATVTTSGDSSVLPVSFVGMQITVLNSGAAPLNVYPSALDAAGAGGKINAGGANAAFSVSNGVGAVFICLTAGQWYTSHYTIG